MISLYSLQTDKTNMWGQRARDSRGTPGVLVMGKIFDPEVITHIHMVRIIYLYVPFYRYYTSIKSVYLFLGRHGRQRGGGGWAEALESGTPGCHS